MNILYIGQYTPGTTSKMRADKLNHILKPDTFDVIDTHIPFHQSHRIWRSLGFRYKRGPLIRRINNYIIKQLNLTLKPQTLNPKPNTFNPKPFNLIWVDKAIFLTPQTTAYLKTLTNKLVHFTPDMAFYSNRSILFENSINYYDYHITTKSAEVKMYEKMGVNDQLIICTQGFDKAIHQAYSAFSEKSHSVAFIGLYEPSREEIVQKLIDNHIDVRLAGKGWQSFIKKNAKNTYLYYVSDGVFGQDYARFISASYFSIGLLSKKFPELHTTRTFEIPACGTALITESNSETESFFKDDEAIFYNSTKEMVEQIKYYLAHLDELELLTLKGTQRVQADGRDYESILSNVLKQIGLL
jgi:spore maturation protein CgeB